MENAKNNNEKILPAIKKLVKAPHLTMRISALFSAM